MRKLLLIVLLVFVAMGGTLKAQVEISLFPYNYAEGRYRQIVYYRIFQINKYEHGQNNEPTTTDYYHYKHILPIQLSTLDNVTKIEVTIVPANSGYSEYSVVKTIKVFSENGKIVYELDGVKREIKNNRMLVDAELTTDLSIEFTSQYLGRNFRYTVDVYNSSNDRLKQIIFHNSFLRPDDYESHQIRGYQYSFPN